MKSISWAIDGVNAIGPDQSLAALTKSRAARLYAEIHLARHRVVLAAISLRSKTMKVITTKSGVTANSVSVSMEVSRE